MTRPLAGKVALITGGSRGIGAAITTRLAAEGATVAFSYARTADAATHLVQTLRDEGAQAAAYRADQADPASCARLVSEVVETYGPLDILINSAGVYKTGAIGPTGAAQAPFPGIGDYVATKAALAAYTRAWSRDLGARQITVNIVQPGAVNTDMNPADGPTPRSRSR
ncbi:MAG: SDR family NAD(P)-dependent oxidoreductase [Mycobacterium sp.]